ncbi:MAG: hypothetical protein ACRDCG_01405 [Mycoplasmoidaceae bacterium]
MSEKINFGYLLEFIEYDDYDHILFFLLNNNKILKLFSKGSQKTLSKNGRFLLFGSLTEIEYFLSRSLNKLSRLKKINGIKMLSFFQSQNPTIFYLNNFILKKQYEYFNFENYKQIIEITLSFDIHTSFIYCLIKIINYEGLKIIHDRCIMCKQKNIYHFSFEKCGFLCKNCFQYFNDKTPTSKEFNKIIYYSFKEEFILISKYENDIKLKLINLLSDFINNNTGIYIDYKNFRF